MSALSFLSKKSWHTGLQQNQEAVWKAEKSALEERRKLDELRKERDREREIQELERLQEESGGKKRRVEKVDWMYNAPASGSNIDKNELEDYLLGKKRVDKLLKADEGLQHSRGNQEGPISEQKAIGSDRDVAAKIREDPMFAIKMQEQAAYQALLKDPARLRAMKKAAGLDKVETKEERRRRKEEKRARRKDDEERGSRPDRGREEDRYRGSSRYDDERSRYNDERRSYRSRSRSRSRDRYERSGDRRWDDRDTFKRESYTDRRRDGSYNRNASQYDSRRQDNYPSRNNTSYRSRQRSRSPQADRREGPSEAEQETERQAKLAAMQQNATQLTSSRSDYLAKIKQEDDENAKREEELRMKLQKSREKGYSDGKGSFLVKQQKDLYGSGMDLNERLKRSREGLQRLDGD
jgi:hypothetical protein